MSQPGERILDGDALLRRIADKPDLYKRLETGELRVTSVAFNPSRSDAGISVDVRRMLPDPRSPETAVDDHLGHGLIEFTAELPRRHELDVEHAPIPGNSAHANIVGLDRFTPAQAKRIRRNLALEGVRWVREPDGARHGPC